MQYDAGQIGNVTAYERGNNAIIFSAAAGNVPQVGNAQPVLAIAYGLAPSNANDQLSELIALQIDATGTLAGTVNLLASLDNVSYYVVGTFTVAAGVGQYINNFGLGARYICASLTGTSGTGTITVSFAA